MLPMKAVRLLLGTLLAADDTTLAPAANANKIALIMTDFALTEDLLAGDLVFATFDGATPIAGALGAQPVAIDPTTQQQVITIKDPLGGYRWVTSGLTHLPQTIYGFALLDSTLATLLAVEKFNDPLTLTEEGQQIDLGRALMTLLSQPIA